MSSLCIGAGKELAELPSTSIIIYNYLKINIPKSALGLNEKVEN